MTIRHLKIFLALCQNNFNTTKAADALHMTQPAVSLAIRELEDYYGVRLFDRVGRRLVVTEAGNRFWEYASHIISLFGDMEQGMRNWDSLGLLRVGASITIGSQFLPSYVKAFYARFPGAQVRATIAPSDQIERAVLNNELDFALIEGVPTAEALVGREYMEDYLTVICPPELGFSQGQLISIEEFRKQSFLLREKGSGTREIFDSVTEHAGFSVTPLWEAMSTTALVNAVINGIGTSVLPYRMVEKPLKMGLVVSVRVKGLKFRRSYYIVHHREKYLSSSAKAFMELCYSYEMDYPMPEYNVLY